MYVIEVDAQDFDTNFGGQRPQGEGLRVNAHPRGFDERHELLPMNLLEVENRGAGGGSQAILRTRPERKNGGHPKATAVFKV